MPFPDSLLRKPLWFSGIFLRCLLTMLSKIAVIGVSPDIKRPANFPYEKCSIPSE
jgi:hypothetical protein